LLMREVCPMNILKEWKWRRQPNYGGF